MLNSFLLPLLQSIKGLSNPECTREVFILPSDCPNVGDFFPGSEVYSVIHRREGGQQLFPSCLVPYAYFSTLME